mmetsp:Transcript_4270/g.7151  ORF Transcript_4270/g.7151 Transcript_4270/m.7151 type:complete len:311 (+) Transcript_4270:52-984(+)
MTAGFGPATECQHDIMSSTLANLRAGHNPITFVTFSEVKTEMRKHCCSNVLEALLCDLRNGQLHLKDFCRYVRERVGPDVLLKTTKGLQAAQTAKALSVLSCTCPLSSADGQVDAIEQLKAAMLQDCSMKVGDSSGSDRAQLPAHSMEELPTFQALVHALLCPTTAGCLMPSCADIKPLLVKAEAHTERCAFTRGCITCDKWRRMEHLRNHCRRKLIAKSCKAIRLRLLMMRWRCFSRCIGIFIVMHQQAAERAYSPGGIGFKRSREDFEEMAVVYYGVPAPPLRKARTSMERTEAAHNYEAAHSGARIA